jgi:hypothetical protein
MSEAKQAKRNPEPKASEESAFCAIDPKPHIVFAWLEQSTAVLCISVPEDLPIYPKEHLVFRVVSPEEAAADLSS